MCENASPGSTDVDYLRSLVPQRGRLYWIDTGHVRVARAGDPSTMSPLANGPTLQRCTEASRVPYEWSAEAHKAQDCEKRAT